MLVRSYHFKVEAFCEACEAPIENIIRKTGLTILTVNTDFKNKKTTVQVEVDPILEDNNEEIIKNALRDGCRLIEEEAPPKQELAKTELTIVSSTLSPVIPPTALPTFKKPRWLSILLGVIGVASGAALMALMLSGIGIPFALMAGLGIGSAVLSLGLGAETIYNAALHLIKSRTLNMDTLYALGGLIAIGVTIGHLFLPGIFPMIFDAALLIFGFKHIGDAVKGSFLNSTSTETKFSDRVNTIMALDATGEKIALDNIPVGTIIRVPRGSIIPINGEILDDEAVIYKTLLNGKTNPKLYSQGKAVLSGFRIDDKNKNEFVRIRTTATLNDSYLKQLDFRLEQEKEITPQASSIKDKILPWFIPVVLTLAIVAALAMGIAFFPALGLTAAVAIGLKCLIGVLVSACPCTLGLVIPSLANAGVEKAKLENVIFKDEKSLRTAAQVNAIAFDLNGTLTLGKPIVKSFFTTLLPERFLGYAKAAEKNSRHANARAIFDFCSANKTCDYEIGSIDEYRTGISATISTNNNKKIVIGNADLMKEHKMDVGKYKQDNNIKTKKLQQLTYLSFGDQIVGHFVSEDPIKPEAFALIQKLKSLDYEIYLFTGDNNEIAQAYAEIFSINAENVYANCKNTAKESDGNVRTKPACVRLVQKSGRILAMIGDAGNDAISMLTSHLGIAVRSASSDDMTLSMASVVIDDVSLSPIMALFETAKQTENQIRNSLITSLSLNGLVIGTTIVGVALTGLGIFFLPAIGAGLMVLSLVPIAIYTAQLNSEELEAYERVKAEARKGIGTLELRKELECSPDETLFVSSGVNLNHPTADEAPSPTRINPSHSAPDEIKKQISSGLR